MVVNRDRAIVRPFEEEVEESSIAIHGVRGKRRLAPEPPRATRS